MMLEPISAFLVSRVVTLMVRRETIVAQLEAGTSGKTRSFLADIRAATHVSLFHWRDRTAISMLCVHDVVLRPEPK
jgi:hypothetical protein